uniref:Cytochrome b6-f complex subunit 6 n=1 Tax=Pedobesia claviformis TaxID=2364088 RepID=A0A386B122_9CHLO|nr:cytochrome b6-f complex subunit 6 [Pedobesia claviformis]AYC65343.1 cytochrome b6-f complex subunit 6 [Pedobesia claviformis]
MSAIFIYFSQFIVVLIATCIIYLLLLKVKLI